MLLIAVLVAPLLMFAATRVESRLGPAAGGWVTALPISFAIVVALLGASQRQLAAGLAASSAAHLAAQVLFAVLTGALLLRRGVLLAGLVGLAGYLAASLLLAQLPNLIAIGLGGLALLVAPRLFPPAMPRQGDTSRRPAGLIGLSAALVVGAAVLAGQIAGPGVGGAVAAFPTVSGALCVAVSRSDVRQSIDVLSGLVRSLPCYATFAVIVAVGMPGLGLVALPLAAVGALVAASVSWRRLPVPRSDSKPAPHGATPDRSALGSLANLLQIRTRAAGSKSCTS